jgi:hypothetical protein
VRETLNEWSFGQILALLLLLAPLYSIISHYLWLVSPSTHAKDEVRVESVHEQHVGEKTGISTPSRSTSSLRRHHDLNLRVDPAVAISSLFSELNSSVDAIPDSKELQNAVRATIQFKIILTLICLVLIGSTGGFFAQSFVAFLGPAVPLSWLTTSWLLVPDVLATGAALAAILIVSISLPFFSQRLAK